MSVSTVITSFGEELFNLRVRTGLTQAEVALRANLKRGYYSQLENSRKGPPPLRTLQRIASALELNEAQTNSLRAIANVERCSTGPFAKEMPSEVASLVMNLLRTANNIPVEKLHRIEAILQEE